MKCTYCNKQTNIYQQYNQFSTHVSPLCTHHINSRTQELYIVPNHIPDAQHQLYLWQKYGEFTNGKDLDI
jgi:hypothetical protein